MRAVKWDVNTRNKMKNNAKSQIGNTFDEVMKKSTKYHMKRIEYSLFTF